MAELTIDELKELVGKWEEVVRLSAAGNLDGVKAAINGLAPSIQNWKSSLTGVSNAVIQLKNSFDSLDTKSIIDGLSGIKDKLMETVNVSNDTSRAVLDLAAGLTSLVLIASGKLKMAEEMRYMASNSADATAQMLKMSNTIGDVLPKTGALATLFNSLGDNVKNVFAAMDNAQNLEITILRASAAGGEFSNIIASIGKDTSNMTEAFAGLADITANFAAQTAEIATANNITAGTAAQYTEQLMRIPGAMRETIDVTGDSTKSIHMLDAMLKVSSGTFQDFGTVMSDMNMLFQNFGKFGEGTLSVIARMHTAAQALNIPMETMRGAVRTAADQFKFLGDNSNTAINILSGMQGALSKSGLGPQAISQLAGNFTNLISKMDIAQRAFVSSQTGGPGGLQGAFKMTLAMQQGQGTEVAQQIEQALRQMMGGQLVNLQQASKSEAAAAQMTKQIQMLTSGPLAVAQDEGQAIRIIEAMNKGQLFQAGEEIKGATPQDALRTVVETGNAIQERQTSYLLKISNEIERQGTLASILANEVRRNIEGPGTDIGNETQEARENATIEAAKTPYGAGGMQGQVDRDKAAIGGALEKVSKPAYDFIENSIKPMDEETKAELKKTEPPPLPEPPKEFKSNNQTNQTNQQTYSKKEPDTIIIKVVNDKGMIESVINVMIQDGKIMSADKEIKGAYGTP